ncbi:MAG: hypothetical protein AABZ74_09660 [Cyanobacteriota bacterium]
MKKFFVAIISSSLVFFNTSISYAQNLSVSEILNNSLTKGTKQSFSGKKVQMTIRKDLRLEAIANVDYVDKENLNITMKSPIGVFGINYQIYKNESLIHFPYEKLSFTDAPATSGDMMTDTIIGKITNEYPLLEQNYDISLLPDDQILGKECYVVKITPKVGRNGNNSYWGEPGKTFWINKDNFQTMREDRYWLDGIEPYFSSQYKEYKPLSYKDSPKVRVKLPATTKKIVLGSKKEKVETFLEIYKTPEEIEKKLKTTVSVPSYLPNGFKLREIMVMNFYDTKIIIEKFDDGLNSLFVTYRTKPNIFLVLTAGSFSIPLIQKMSDLSLNAPYNYKGKETNENLIISFGDLYPEDLTKINDSLNLK